MASSPYRATKGAAGSYRITMRDTGTFLGTTRQEKNGWMCTDTKGATFGPFDTRAGAIAVLGKSPANERRVDADAPADPAAAEWIVLGYTAAHDSAALLREHLAALPASAPCFTPRAMLHLLAELTGADREVDALPSEAEDLAEQLYGAEEAEGEAKAHAERETAARKAAEEKVGELESQIEVLQSQIAADEERHQAALDQYLSDLNKLTEELTR